MLDLQSLMVVSAISLSVAALTFHIVSRPAAPEPNAQAGPARSTRFLYDGPELLDASEGGEDLLGLCSDRCDWQELAKLLMPRFPGFPAMPPNGLSKHPITLDSADIGARSQVVIENIRGLIRVSLIEHSGDPATSAGNLHRQRLQAERIETLCSAAHSAPYPIWQTDQDGKLRWSNTAYDQLAQACFKTSSVTPPLFDLQGEYPNSTPRNRMSVTVNNGAEELWYDVTSVRTDDFTMHYAMDVNAVVQGQAAQKNFVQTLTKTFAQLSIGLAIFNRKRELALFNPALADLTGLPVSFLSNRPDLHGFFDRLRDNQTMPEPKDYTSWREKMDDLANAAADGRYLETWNLPSGLTYRVSGRPHPDGAVAFLFEDISAEISLTRRFRADLELNQSVIDHLDIAVAVFSASGQLYLCNELYREIWQTDPDHSCAEVSIRDSLDLWQQSCLPSDRWDDIARFVTSANPAPDPGGVVQLSNGTRLNTRMQRIRGGASMVVFDFASPAKRRISLAKTT